MKKLLRYLVYCSLSVFLLLLVINGVLLYAAKGKIYNDVQNIPARKYALLLGTAKLDPKTGDIFEYYSYRVEAAVKLYRAGKIDYIIVSSENSKQFGYTAEALCKDLIANGVPATRIITDRFGFRTLDSVLRCKQVYGVDTVTIISQWMHSQRSLYIAENKGVQAIAFAADGDDRTFDPGTIFHEQAARILMVWDLIINTQPANVVDR